MYDIFKLHTTFVNKLKKVAVYVYKKYGAKKSWNQRHNTVFNNHPDYRLKCDTEIEKKHKKLWSPFNSHFSPNTLRVCKNISGKCNTEIVPEEIFQVDIEPSLNRYCLADFFEHKSFYNKWHKGNIFPEDYLHSINGKLLNSELDVIDLKEAKNISEKLKYPVVLKANFETYGGKNINFINTSEELINYITNIEDFVVQEKMSQHELLAKFHRRSLNTVRACLYRSVTDNKVYFLHAALRMGRNGSLDNVSAGGLVSFINEKGRMHGYALNKYGEKFFKHPNTKMTFTDKLPAYEELKSLSIEIMRHIFYARVVGLDLCFDSDGNWRVIEVNINSNTIRFAQYAGEPFFKEFTSEVIKYCKHKHWILSQT